MKKFRIGVYELYVSAYEVEAENEAEAIEKFNNDEATYVENSSDYLELAEKYQGEDENGNKYQRGIAGIEEVK